MKHMSLLHWLELLRHGMATAIKYHCVTVFSGENLTRWRKNWGFWNSFSYKIVWLTSPSAWCAFHRLHLLRLWTPTNFLGFLPASQDAGNRIGHEPIHCVLPFVKPNEIWYFSGAQWSDMGPRFGTPIWDPDLGPRFGTLIRYQKALVENIFISARIFVAIWHMATW
jgi:hypothetical protein